jgi:NitT/TauT family transport system substrate-binding protein
LSACGDDDDGNTAAEDASAPTEGQESNAAAEDDLITVKWAFPGHVPLYMTQDYAMAHGLFQENGIELDEQPSIFNAAEVLQIVLSGDADMAFTSPVVAFAAVDQGQDAVIVANVTGSPIDIALSTDTMAALSEDGVTAESSMEDKLAALEGLTLAHPGVGSGTETIFLLTLDKYGVDSGSMTLQPITDPAAMTAAAREGAVDGVIHTTAGVPTQLVGDGVAELFISIGSEDDEIGAIPSLGLVTTQRFLDENPDAVERVIRTFQASRDAILSAGEDDLSTVKAEFYPDYNEELYYISLEQLKPVIAEGTMTMTEAMFDGLLAAYNATLNSPADLIIDDVYDGSLVEAVEGA